jgi:hypothetical protein
LYPWERVDFNWNITYVWNSDLIASWTKETNIVEYTIRHDGTTYKDAHFSKDFEVTVLKPTITTTGWGTSYVWNIWNLSNVSTDGNWVVSADKNKNFVWASIGWLSSYSKWVNVVDSDVVDDKNNVESSFSGSFDNSNTNWGNYNWIDNVYIRDGDFILSDITIPFTNDWISKTYIINNWDLYINDDIDYSGNIAFIVKWWDILIDKSVLKIEGTYISMPKSNWLWWLVKWYDQSVDNKPKTINVLQIKWSIYWNINHLLATRTYIKNNKTTWLIDVGTIVSFGSSVFRKPAPLTAKFIAKYLESQKVAQ